MKKLATILAGLILFFTTSAFTGKIGNDTKSNLENEINSTTTKAAIPLEEQSQVFGLPESVLVEEDKVFTKVEIDALFSKKGGWANYVKNVVESSVEELLEEGSSVTCKITFVVCKDGTVRDVKALTMQDSRMAKIVMEAFKNAPKWIPAQQNGFNVNSKRVQEISFLIK